MRFFLSFVVVTCFLFSCKKESFISSPDAILIARADTVRFDTVFTTAGSVTKYFTLVNDNDQKLMVSHVGLAGGATSSFSINVDGVAGTSFSDLELNAHDSMYVFVKVSIDPQSVNSPFLVQDSIEINYNGNTSKVFLQAFGQNARYITDDIKKSTTWDNSLPYVIQNTLTVAEGVTLTIQKGTRIYTHATAALIVDGTLKVMGEKEGNERVVFRSDRLDEPYKDLPGGWPGIVFTGSSHHNEMHYANVLNAYQAIVVAGGAAPNSPQLVLSECVIQNAYDVGLYALNSSIEATNCLISQCGNGGQPGVGGSNILITGGGQYSFAYCTIATYANFYQDHKQPVCFVSNSDAGIVAPLQADFTNCIMYGEGSLVEDELIVQKASTDAVALSNCIYKMKNSEPAGVVFTDCIKNVNPLFDSINTNLHTYNFRLRDTSPAIDAAKNTSTGIDLDGAPRPAGTKPDIGCYERQ